MEMNLYEAIKDRKKYLPEKKAKSWIYQTLKALEFMHRNGIFHRDIKPENILIQNNQVKLADLGSCKGMYSKPPFTEYISTRWYRSPECLLTDGYYNYKMDIWGLGCVFFELLTLTPLFPGDDEDKEGKILKGYPLHSSTPPVILDDKEYDIAGKFFSELDEDVQNELLNRNFSIALIEEYTQEDAEELFYLINSGVALSKIQKSKSKMGTKNIEFFTELLSGSFFTTNTVLSKKQAMNEDDLLTLIQASMLLDNEYYDRDYSSIGAPAALDYATEIKDNYSKEQMDRIHRAIDYLDQAFEDDKKIKFFNKNNIPIVITVAEIASAYSELVPCKDFRDFIIEYAGEDCEKLPADYKSGSGAGNVKAPKVQQRLLSLYTALRQHFSEGFDERLPFSSEIDVKTIEDRTKEAVIEYNIKVQAKEEARRQKEEEQAQSEEESGGEESLNE